MLHRFDYLVVRFSQLFGLDSPIALSRFHYWFSWGQMRSVRLVILQRVISNR